MENNLERMQNDFDQLEPKERFKYLFEMSKFILPSLKSIEFGNILDELTEEQFAEVIEKIKLERGLLGGIWGNSEKIPNNIAALLILILLLTAIIYTYCLIGLPTDKISLPIKDFWEIIAPLITLAIGYLFGGISK